MIRFESMTEDAWKPILEASIRAYAAERIRAGSWIEEEAMARARAEFAHLLPEGLQTTGHHICSVMDETSNEAVGYLWYQTRDKAGAPCIFLYDIQIFQAHRRQGYAAAALQVLERLALEAHGANRIELHVFGPNAAARNLYAKAGYEEIHVMMAKVLP